MGKGTLEDNCEHSLKLAESRDVFLNGDEAWVKIDCKNCKLNLRAYQVYVMKEYK